MDVCAEELWFCFVASRVVKRNAVVHMEVPCKHADPMRNVRCLFLFIAMLLGGQRPGAVWERTSSSFRSLHGLAGSLITETL